MKLFLGNFVCTPDLNHWKVYKRHYIGVDDTGRISFIEPGIPELYKDLPVDDLGDGLVIPGFVDLHVHASQWSIRGLGYEEEADWFRQYCYPAEKRYADDLSYAHRINGMLLRQIRRHGITRACIMGTTDVASVQDLVLQYEKSGLSARIGKMNSDRSAFGEALEKTEISMKETLEFLDFMNDRGPLVKPALCPEFAPACTENMMRFLGNLARERKLLIHSHMSEGDFDVAMVAQAFPKQRTYASVYDQFGIFSEDGAVMAHCLNVSEEEVPVIAGKNMIMAHCPMAAMDGGGQFLFPAVKYLEAGITIGLGSDIGGGHTLNMMQNMVAAIHMSRLIPESRSLTASECLYMATKGGGKAFGQVGSFETGYEFDALVIDDSEEQSLMDRSLIERAVQFMYCGEPEMIKRVFCSGREI